MVREATNSIGTESAWTEADLETLKTALKVSIAAGVEWFPDLERTGLAAVWAAAEQRRAEAHAERVKRSEEMLAKELAQDAAWAEKNPNHPWVTAPHATPEPMPVIPDIPEALFPYLVKALRKLSSLPEEVYEAAIDRAEEAYEAELDRVQETYLDDFEEWLEEQGIDLIARETLSFYDPMSPWEGDPVESMLHWQENSRSSALEEYLNKQKARAIKAAESAVRAATRVLNLLQKK